MTTPQAMTEHWRAHLGRFGVWRGFSQVTPALAAELERLTVTLLEALDVSGYILPDKASVTEQNVRRLVRRLNSGPEDATLLMGMLRQILWKMRGSGTK